MDYAKLAEKYIQDHNNPIVRTELFGSKLFLSSLNEDETQLKDKCFTNIENALKQDRVDRRVARSIGEWRKKENKAAVTKITGSTLTGYGFQNKNGKFLNSEEATFFLETNKLELRQNKIPMSLQEAYKNILKSRRHFDKYLMYKKLILQGYKLKAADKTRAKDEPKRKLVTTGEGTSAKVAKLQLGEGTDMSDIFAKLRQSGPRAFQSGTGNQTLPDYRISVAEKSEHFNVFMSDSDEFNSMNADENGLNICAIHTDDHVSFYKYVNTNIPVLS
jgi:hypothetical protein